MFTIIMAVLLVLGFPMDQLAVLVLTLPIVFPVLRGLEFDPVHLGIVIVKTVEIGLITPPTGLNCYVVSSVSGVPVHRVFRGIWVFVAFDVLLLVVLSILPELSLFLPGWANVHR